MDAEHIAIAALSFIGSLIGAGAVLFLGWRKLKPEIGKISADTNSTQADASVSWATSNEMAGRQIVVLQKQIEMLQTMLVEAKTEISELRVMVQVQTNLVKRLTAQVVSRGEEPVK